MTSTAFAPHFQSLQLHPSAPGVFLKCPLMPVALSRGRYLLCLQCFSQLLLLKFFIHQGLLGVSLG